MLWFHGLNLWWGKKWHDCAIFWQDILFAKSPGCTFWELERNAYLVAGVHALEKMEDLHLADPCWNYLLNHDGDLMVINHGKLAFIRPSGSQAVATHALQVSWAGQPTNQPRFVHFSCTCTGQLESPWPKSNLFAKMSDVPQKNMSVDQNCKWSDCWFGILGWLRNHAWRVLMINFVKNYFSSLWIHTSWALSSRFLSIIHQASCHWENYHMGLGQSFFWCTKVTAAWNRRRQLAAPHSMMWWMNGRCAWDFIKRLNMLNVQHVHTYVPFYRVPQKPDCIHLKKHI